MKKLLAVIATLALPFLAVWLCAIFTAFSFNPIHVFQHGDFWGFSVLYWFVWTMMSPFIIPAIFESFDEQTSKN